MKNLQRIMAGLALAFVLTACGSKVNVPPAHVGKVMTKDGYQASVLPPSKFRLSPCMAYCDNLVLLDVSDKTKLENITVFIPTDKLNLKLGVQVTLSLNQAGIAPLFGKLSPEATDDSRVSIIKWDSIYQTYAQQVILTETREYLSKYSIAQIASNLEKVNADLRVILQKKIQATTPFTVRYAGITNIVYPTIITNAQENAAKRREMIQQEEAQLQISKVQLERELQETRLRRQIDLEKAEIEAKAQLIQREVVDEKVLKLRQLENDRAWIDKWNGTLPATMMGGKADILLNVPSK